MDKLTVIGLHKKILFSNWKNNELLSHKKTWMSLTSILQVNESTYSMISITWYSGKSKTIKTVEKISEFNEFKEVEKV